MWRWDNQGSNSTPLIYNAMSYQLSKTHGMMEINLFFLGREINFFLFDINLEINLMTTIVTKFFLRVLMLLHFYNSNLYSKLLTKLK
jgi:hypothetical protein